MGIKLIKKESMERCDSCGAIMTEYDYDRYGGLCKYCRSKESKHEDSDGFSHTWELQAQQAKETLEEITKKFGDTDRLAFEIRNFPHAHECDVVVTVDGNPFITAEFEGGRHCGIRWHCFEDDVSDMHLDPSDANGAKKLITTFSPDILDALESLYGFGAIADEGGQRVEKTAWTYLVELETLEGAESRQEATEKILKALGYNPGTEGRWYNTDGEEIGIIDTLDNTEWDFAVKTCGQLQESKKSETAPDEYARNNFLEGALDYAEIKDDKGNVVLLKLTKRYANEIGGDFCLRSYDGETDKSLAMGGIRYVVDRFGELLDMDPAEAIIEIAKE